MDVLAKLSDLLPGAAAKWTALLSIALSALIFALLPWLLSDTPIAPSLAQKLSVLLLAGAPLLLGSFLILYFVVRHSNNLHSESTKLNNLVAKSEADIKVLASSLQEANAKLLSAQTRAGDVNFTGGAGGSGGDGGAVNLIGSTIRGGDA